VQASV
jgi:hypothetical protein